MCMGFSGSQASLGRKMASISGLLEDTLEFVHQVHSLSADVKPLAQVMQQDSEQL